MYQALGAKKLNKLRFETGLNIERAIVRGGENHTGRPYKHGKEF